MKPIVAVVGRPNVGKSTIFNRIVGDRAAIVENTPGVTRDRLYRDVEWLDHNFVLVDTGGLEPNSDDYIMKMVRFQAQVAIDEADVIVFVVDGQAGITGLDEDVTNILRKSKKPIILAVNKIDDVSKHEELLYEFYGLGFERLIAISAEHNMNIGDLLDAVCEEFGDIESIEEEEGLHIALIGRPNVGKSSLANKLLGEDRTIVSDVAGTTRDAIDTAMEYNGQKYVFIDTAGIRRKSKIDEALEYYTVLRAIKAIKRAEICLIMVDAVEGVTEQDQRIAGLAHDEKKAMIIVVNKWDLIEKETNTMKEYEEVMRTSLPFLQYAPMVFISALEGTRVLKVLSQADFIYEEYTKRISTGLLNQILKDAVILNPPPTRKGRAIKINYITQVTAAPPKFIVFSNHPDQVHFSYKRYLENKLRDAFGFEGCPIELIMKKKGN